MRRTAGAAALRLQELASAQLRRTRLCVQDFTHPGRLVRVRVEGRELVNFCSNDYLGLARDPRLAQAMAQAARRWGSGSGAAHLVTGHSHAHHALEERLAAFTGREAALLFSTGYMANVGVVSAFADRGEVVVQDRLNHASLLDGARLSGARLLRHAHADAADAARQLQAAGEGAALLATDGVFSMDGDLAPLAQLAPLARRHDAWLLVDDAHGLGVTGASGRGTLEQAGLDAQAVPLLVGTLGKAFGCFGAFVAGDRDVVEWVLQRARSYIYTTAMPPAVAAAAHAAVDIAEREGWRRERLAALIARFRRGAMQLGLPLGESATPIQPLHVGDAARCLAASAALRERGLWVAAIRRPTVPAGTERLRVTLTAGHEEGEVDQLLEALAAVLPAGGRP